MFPSLSFLFPVCSLFQMARNKRKATATVPHRQDNMHVLVPNPDDYDGLVVLDLKAAYGGQSGAVLHESISDTLPQPSSPPGGVSLSNPHLDNEMTVASESKSKEEVLVEDCSYEEDLEEEQLDFTFLDEERERSPKSPSPPPVEHMSPPCTDGQDPDVAATIGKSLSPLPGDSKWRDLFSSNRNSESCTKL